MTRKIGQSLKRSELVDLKLSGKIAVVTGGAQGIGRAIVDELLAEGAVVAIVDRDRLDRVEQLVEKFDGRALAIQADVSDASNVERVSAEVEGRCGRIDILVNNAGILSRKPILEDDPVDWERVLRTNLFGCYHCVRAMAPGMVARRHGRIINISSIHGTVAKAGMGSYCTSKAAIDMFTKQLAVELGPSGITVNAVAPGTISTEINVPLYKSTRPEDIALREATLRRVPAGRIGEPDNVGRAVAFLASEAAPYINGTTLYVDGGYIAEGTPRL
jgi:gluconate 5-dehydrogenase/3-oxoacyl-[acyl-carrier protein] reductase